MEYVKRIQCRIIAEKRNLWNDYSNTTTTPVRNDSFIYTSEVLKSHILKMK